MKQILVALVLVTARAALAQEPPPAEPPLVDAPAIAQPAVAAPAVEAPAVEAPPPLAAPPPIVTPAPRAPLKRYVIEKRVSWPLLGAGIGVFASSWIPTLVLLYSTLGAIPVLGPFILVGQLASSSPSSPDCHDDACSAGAGLVGVVMAALIFDGLIQVAGASLLIAGAIVRRNVGTYKNVTLAPVTTPRYSGLSLTVRF